ncbi:MAG: hypothetical protein J1E63_08925 [Muribaculaceae bacterium]|nr:hypothetical protein [Muribaculaceae bacterium]
MKRNLFLLLAIFVGMATLKAATYVPLTDFKDATFQTYLKTAYKNQLSTDGKSINVEEIYFINIGSSSDYVGIASLEGIKKLINLEAIYLPGRTSNLKGTFKLTKLDVSGMQKLRVIDNGGYIKYTASYTATSSSGGGTSPSAEIAKNIGNYPSYPLTEVIADDCPALEYVALSKYNYLKTLSLNGSTNVKNLYLGSNDALETIDISELPNITNRQIITSSPTSASSSAVSYSTTTTNSVNNFCMTSMTNLKELKIGNHPDIQGFAIINENKLQTLDISGLPNLTVFMFRGNTDAANSESWTDKILKDENGDYVSEYTSINHEYHGQVPLKEIILPEAMTALKYFELKQTQVRHLDIEPFAAYVAIFNVESNLIGELDITKLTKATNVFVGNNCLYELATPNSPVVAFRYSMNRLTWIPNYSSNTKKVYISDTNPSRMQQNLYIPEGAMSYKCFNDPAALKQIMFEDEPDGTDIFGKPVVKPEDQKNYLAPRGGHFGVEADHEDPLTFYFDSPTGTAYYYFYFNAYPGNSQYLPRQYCRVILHHGLDAIAEEYYQPKYTFYLVGDYNDWSAEDAHQFQVVDAVDGKYTLNLHGTSVADYFRVCDAKTREEASLDFGGDDVDRYKFNTNYTGEHIFTTYNYKYALGTKENQHYTTHYHEVNNQKGALKDPVFELRYNPDDLANNYLLLTSGSTTGVADIVDDTVNAPVEYFNLQGINVNPTTPGIYIRRQGSKVEKVTIR